jgi:putative N6-adenine-specific DNA methylase
VVDAAKFDRSTQRGVIVTNPPYGKRLLDETEARRICTAFAAAVKKTSGWGVYVLTADEELDKCFGRRADKVRRMYNGTIRCGYYMYK